MGFAASFVWAIVEAVERAGVTRAALFAGTNVAPERLARVHERFDVHEFALIQTRALDLTRDEALGLHIAEHVQEASFDIVAHLVSHSPTLRDALNQCLQFQRLALEDAQLLMREKGSVVTLEDQFVRSTERADRMHAEFIVAGLARLIRTVRGAAGVAHAALFEHARPAHHREYARIFGGIEKFGQTTTGITFDQSLLDGTQQWGHHPELYSALRAEAERALDRVTEGVSAAEQLRRYLVARPPSRIPDPSTAARDLGMSERSLRRRLAAESTSYRDLVRAILEMHADHMLRDPRRSIQETAHALGFADAATFHRAFKRWTGRTPKEYREQRPAPLLGTLEEESRQAAKPPRDRISKD
jgi:AraC-like DNA-binding protein